MTEVQRQMAGDSFPGRFSYFISAPSSPSRASEFYQEFNDFTQEFAFHVTGDQASKAPASASDLFSGGVIRSPLAQPEISPEILLLSAVGSKKSKGGSKKKFWSNFAPKKKKQDNPYARVPQDTFAIRGREQVPPQSTSAAPRRREARSLSPVRPPCSPLATLATGAKSSRKWRLKNFLLFRSASEGRASDKDPMRKVTSFYRRSQQEDVAKGSNPSSRSTMEKHYTLNKAASEDLKKKTFLPYKQGILGRLAVNPTVHSLAHGFGSLPTS